MFGGNFAPTGWALCDGQLIQVSQNEPLYSLLGTAFGGDGRSTFGLPDLRGRAPIHMGSGAGLSTRFIGAKGGAEKVTLSVNTIPSHRHVLNATQDPAIYGTPGDLVLAEPAGLRAYSDKVPDAEMGGTAVSNVGGDQSHGNLQPYLCINFIIALVGLFPSRN